MIITSEAINNIIDNAQGKSIEVCGLLAGAKDRITHIFRMVNTDQKPETGYLMDPLEQLAIMKEIRKKGLELLGIYHSHPSSPAYPSQKDIELAYYDALSYLIISLLNKEPEIRAFRIENGKVREEKIETTS